MLTNCYYVSPPCHCVKVSHSRPSFAGGCVGSCVAFGKRRKSSQCGTARRRDQTSAPPGNFPDKFGKSERSNSRQPRLSSSMNNNVGAINGRKQTRNDTNVQ